MKSDFRKLDSYLGQKIHILTHTWMKFYTGGAQWQHWTRSPSLLTYSLTCQRSSETMGIGWALIGLLVTVGFPFGFIWSDWVLFSTDWCIENHKIPAGPPGKLKPCLDVLRLTVSLSVVLLSRFPSLSCWLSLSLLTPFLWAEVQQHIEWNGWHFTEPCFHFFPDIRDLSHGCFSILLRDSLVNLKFVTVLLPLTQSSIARNCVHNRKHI